MNTTGRSGLEFDIAGFSEQGPRAENQDAFVTDAFSTGGLVALADGMGGEKSGRAAADTALAALQSAAPIANVESARRAVRDADRAVSAAADSNPEMYGGMGCALGLLALADNRDGPGWIAGHVGDVRILSLSPDGVLRLESRDHTPAFARWEAGEISLDEIPDSSGANRLQRAVGRGGEADVTWLPAAPGWSWILMSDGVYKAMRMDEIAVAMKGASAAAICETIRSKVDQRGPDDNYTAVVVRANGGARPLPSPGVSSHQNDDTMIDVPRSQSGRSGAAGFALGLAVLALVLAGVALWSARGAAGSAEAPMAEIEALRAEIDSLRASFEVADDPFGPLAPSATPDTNVPPGAPR